MHLCEPLSDFEDFGDYYCALLSSSDVRDKYNQTPLHKTCHGGFWERVNLDLVQYLVERAHCDVSEYLTYSYSISTLQLNVL